MLASIACTLTAGLALVACERSAAPADPATRELPVVHVAAAADLARAFEELGALFEQEHDLRQKPAFTFGSSGLLARQIREGAPFDVFASANEAFVNELVAAGACDPDSQAHYARGRLVIWIEEGLVTPPASIAELKDARFERIAIANPEHAPYGKAAREALQNSGIWRQIEPRIVYGENVRQTHQYAQSGNAEAAIVSLSMVIGARGGHVVHIDQALHAPIDQTLVVCKGGKNRAGGGAFARFVLSSQGRALMRRYGFLLPTEAAADAPTPAASPR